MRHLPWIAPLTAYEAQASDLRAAFRASDAATVRAEGLTDDEARLRVARAYSFRDWDALAEWVTAVGDTTSAVHRFEQAIEAVITGDVRTLRDLLQQHPELVHARSTRITCHDPAVHGATLVHYLGANGVEGHRQRSPANAVEVAQQLFAAGADPDALAGMYGGRCATMSLLVSSTPPHEAGVQVPLVHALIDAGASPDGSGVGPWQSPVNTALVFGFTAAADALVARGARVDDIVTAAGMGRADRVAAMLPSASLLDRHRAITLAAKANRLHVVRLLLDAGEDVNRLNPDGMHSHSTLLHQAAADGHLALVQLLVSRGARTDIEDTRWHGTALGWAIHCGQEAVAEFLRA